MPKGCLVPRSETGVHLAGPLQEAHPNSNLSLLDLAALSDDKWLFAIGAVDGGDPLAGRM